MPCHKSNFSYDDSKHAYIVVVIGLRMNQTEGTTLWCKNLGLSGAAVGGFTANMSWTRININHRHKFILASCLQTGILCRNKRHLFSATWWWWWSRKAEQMQVHTKCLNRLKGQIKEDMRRREEEWCKGHIGHFGVDAIQHYFNPSPIIRAYHHHIIKKCRLHHSSPGLICSPPGKPNRSLLWFSVCRKT